MKQGTVTDFTDIKRCIKQQYEQLYAKNLGDSDKMEKFLT